MKTLSQERLKELLHYDHETGIFTWRAYRAGNAKAGMKAGSITLDGRISIGIDRTPYLAHRLAFLWMTGQLPPNDVDHINGVPDDNRWENLRHATRQQNACNRLSCKWSSSQYLGVSFNKARKSWTASIRSDGKSTYLGIFKYERDAAMAYDKAAKKMHGEFANLNFGG